jgi:hypothetical protein
MGVLAILSALGLVLRQEGLTFYPLALLLLLVPACLVVIRPDIGRVLPVPSTAAAVVWGMCSLLWQLLDDGSGPAMLVTFGGLALFAAVWFAALAVLGMSLIADRSRVVRDSLAVAAQTGILVLVAFATLSGLPFAVAFGVSRSALDSLATQALAGRRISTPVRVGVLNVGEVSSYHGTVTFVLHDSAANELIYSPNDPLDAESDTATPLGDNWWRVYHDD